MPVIRPYAFHEFEDAPESQYHEIKRCFLFGFLLAQGKTRLHGIIRGIGGKGDQVIQAFLLTWIRFPDSQFIQQCLQQRLIPRLDPHRPEFSPKVFIRFFSRVQVRIPELAVASGARIRQFEVPPAWVEGIVEADGLAVSFAASQQGPGFYSPAESAGCFEGQYSVDSRKQSAPDVLAKFPAAIKACDSPADDYHIIYLGPLLISFTALHVFPPSAWNTPEIEDTLDHGNWAILWMSESCPRRSMGDIESSNTAFAGLEMSNYTQSTPRPSCNADELGVYSP